MPHEHIPVHANRRAVPTIFHIFPARPSHASSFTLPPAIGYRVRTPRRCFPMGSSEAAFHGIFQRRRCAQRRRTLLPFFPPPPGRTSFFTQPPGQRYRARSPRRCSPKGSSKVAFCGILQGRRGGASRWARLRRASPAGFSNAAKAMLPDGLVRGGFLRAFPMPPRRCSPKGSSEAAFHGLLQGRRGDASRWARLRRLSAGFCRVAEAMLPVGLV